MLGTCPRSSTKSSILSNWRVSRKSGSIHSKAVVAALKRIYQSVTVEEAAVELEQLDTEWGQQYRSVVRMWRNNWDNVIPFFQFPPEIRKVIYTTNAIESLNMSLRKLTRNRRIFPNDESA